MLLDERPRALSGPCPAASWAASTPPQSRPGERRAETPVGRVLSLIPLRRGRALGRFGCRLHADRPRLVAAGLDRGGVEMGGRFLRGGAVLTPGVDGLARP